MWHMGRRSVGLGVMCRDTWVGGAWVWASWVVGTWVGGTGWVLGLKYLIRGIGRGHAVALLVKHEQ